MRASVLVICGVFFWLVGMGLIISSEWDYTTTVRMFRQLLKNATVLESCSNFDPSLDGHTVIIHNCIAAPGDIEYNSDQFYVKGRGFIEIKRLLTKRHRSKDVWGYQFVYGAKPNPIPRFSGIYGNPQIFSQLTKQNDDRYKIAPTELFVHPDWRDHYFPYFADRPLNGEYRVEESSITFPTTFDRSRDGIIEFRFLPKDLGPLTLFGRLRRISRVEDNEDTDPSGVWRSVLTRANAPDHVWTLDFAEWEGQMGKAVSGIGEGARKWLAEYFSALKRQELWRGGVNLKGWLYVGESRDVVINFDSIKESTLWIFRALCCVLLVFGSWPLCITISRLNYRTLNRRSFLIYTPLQAFALTSTTVSSVPVALTLGNRKYRVMFFISLIALLIISYALYYAQATGIDLFMKLFKRIRRVMRRWWRRHHSRMMRRRKRRNRMKHTDEHKKNQKKQTDLFSPDKKQDRNNYPPSPISPASGLRRMTTITAEIINPLKASKFQSERHVLDLMERRPHRKVLDSKFPLHVNSSKKSAQEPSEFDGQGDDDDDDDDDDDSEENPDDEYNSSGDTVNERELRKKRRRAKKLQKVEEKKLVNSPSQILGLYDLDLSEIEMMEDEIDKKFDLKNHHHYHASKNAEPNSLMQNKSNQPSKLFAFGNTKAQSSRNQDEELDKTLNLTADEESDDKNIINHTGRLQKGKQSSFEAVSQNNKDHTMMLNSKIEEGNNGPNATESPVKPLQKFESSSRFRLFDWMRRHKNRNEAELGKQSFSNVLEKKNGDLNPRKDRSVLVLTVSKEEGINDVKRHHRNQASLLRRDQNLSSIQNVSNQNTHAKKNQERTMKLLTSAALENKEKSSSSPFNFFMNKRKKSTLAVALPPTKPPLHLLPPQENLIAKSKRSSKEISFDPTQNEDMALKKEKAKHYIFDHQSVFKNSIRDPITISISDCRSSSNVTSSAASVYSQSLVTSSSHSSKVNNQPISDNCEPNKNPMFKDRKNDEKRKPSSQENNIKNHFDDTTKKNKLQSHSSFSSLKLFLPNFLRNKINPDPPSKSSISPEQKNNKNKNPQSGNHDHRLQPSRSFSHKATSSFNSIFEKHLDIPLDTSLKPALLIHSKSAEERGSHSSGNHSFNSLISSIRSHSRSKSEMCLHSTHAKSVHLEIPNAAENQQQRYSSKGTAVKSSLFPSSNTSLLVPAVRRNSVTARKSHLGQMLKSSPNSQVEEEVSCDISSSPVKNHNYIRNDLQFNNDDKSFASRINDSRLDAGYSSHENRVNVNSNMSDHPQVLKNAKTGASPFLSFSPSILVDATDLRRPIIITNSNSDNNSNMSRAVQFGNRMIEHSRLQNNFSSDSINGNRNFNTESSSPFLQSNRVQIFGRGLNTTSAPQSPNLVKLASKDHNLHQIYQSWMKGQENQSQF